MVQINQEKCVGCGMCVSDCLALNIYIEEKKAKVKGECLKCGHCVAICPADAVSVPAYDMADVESYDVDSFKVDAETLLHAIKFRRSIRFYKPTQVERGVLEQILQAGRYTATARNSQNCHFIFVQDGKEELKNRVWSFIDEAVNQKDSELAKQMAPFVNFNNRRKVNPADDFLFRDAPVVLLIATDHPLDAGLAAQNMENMAVSLGLGALYNGFLQRLVDSNEEIKSWLGIGGKKIQACMLLGYPDRCYVRTAPRKEANVIWR